MPIAALSKTTARQICSGQVIVDVRSVVKELVENSLDANATAIEVKLVGFGLTSIMVKDDGVGIPLSDRPDMAKRYYTSKITKFKDLDDVRSFGFRGEALNSIASLAQSFNITTKTDSDEVAGCYEIDHSGEIISSKSISGTTGTTVVVNRLFQKLPVRRQEALRTGKNNFKAVKEMLEAYALCLPSIRFSLKQVPGNQGAKDTKSQFASWMKAKGDNVMSAARLLFGNHLISQLQYSEYTVPNSENIVSQDNITFELCLPKKNSDPTALEKIDKQYYFINNRPIIPIKSIATIIKKAYQSLCGSEVRRSPFVYFNLTVKKGYDVNWEPSKNDVRIDRLHDVEEAVQKAIEDIWEIDINASTDVQSTELNKVESEDYGVAIASTIKTSSEADKQAGFSHDLTDDSIQENSSTPRKLTNEGPTCAASISLNHPKESLLEWSKGYHPNFQSPVKVLQSKENLEKTLDSTLFGISNSTAVSDITPASPKKSSSGIYNSPLTDGHSGPSTSATDGSHDANQPDAMSRKRLWPDFMKSDQELTPIKKKTKCLTSTGKGSISTGPTPAVTILNYLFPSSCSSPRSKLTSFHEIHSSEKGLPLPKDYAQVNVTTFTPENIYGWRSKLPKLKLMYQKDNVPVANASSGCLGRLKINSSRDSNAACNEPSKLGETRPICVILDEGRLLALDVKRAATELMLQRLLQKHNLPINYRLPKSICLTPEQVGKDRWNVILRLTDDSSGEQSIYIPKQITDDRFRMNALEVWIRYDTVRSTRYIALTATTNLIPEFTNINLLQTYFLQLFDLIRLSDSSDMTILLPPVRQYFDGEANRLANDMLKFHDIDCDMNKMDSNTETSKRTAFSKSSNPQVASGCRISNTGNVKDSVDGRKRMDAERKEVWKIYRQWVACGGSIDNSHCVEWTASGELMAPVLISICSVIE